MNHQITGLGKLKTLLLLLGVMTLAGCDNDKKKVEPNSATSSSQSVATSEKVATPEKQVDTQTEKKTAKVYDAAELEKLAKRYEGRELEIQDVKESQIDGASALVISFSIPLDPKQTFSGKINLMDSQSGRVDGEWELSDDLTQLRFRHISPKRNLAITVDDTITAINGDTLSSSESSLKFTIDTQNIEPSVGFASRGSLLPSKLAGGLPVIALNVNSVDVDFFRVKQNSLPHLLSMWGKRTSLYYWDTPEFLNLAELAYTGRFDLNPRQNTRETLLLPLADAKPLQESGVYIAVMRQAGKYTSEMIPVTMFTISDIGLSVHSYNDQVDIFTQALESGRVLANVEIKLLNSEGNVIAEAKTDKQGHAKLDKHKQASVILAIKDGQTSMLSVSQSALDLSEFSISGPQGYAKQFFAFGPRDIYRPGETVILNALLRDADGKLLPKQPVKVDVLKPDAQVARSFVWQPEEDLYQYSYAIADSAPTGNWSFRFDLGDNSYRYYQFKVEDFMPERMALTIKANENPVSPSEQVTFNITGTYLYGAPAAGNTLQSVIFLRPDREAVKALPGFEFGSIIEEGLSRRLDEFQEQLDNQGFLSFKINNYWSEVKSPVAVVMQASLLESGGRPVTRRAEQMIWPETTMPGIRPLFAAKEVYDYAVDKYKKQPMVDENSIAEFEIVYTDVTGQKLATDELEVQLIQERRDYYWNWSDSEGWRSGYNQKDLIVESKVISIEQGMTAKVEFPVEWGSYRLEVRAPESSMVSSVRFWAGYSWQENGGDGTGSAVRPDQVKLKIDKPSYQPGDKLKVHVEAPAAGNGYLLVESNDAPLWWQEIDVPAGGADFELAIDKNWARHDLYLSAIVIRPGDKSIHATPKRAVGLLHIPLASEQRKLDTQLQAPAKIEPEQKVKVKVKVKAVDGKPLDKVNVLVSAVDTGVLNITDFKTPDPYEAFFGRKRYGIDIYDVYGQLIEGKGRKANLRFGGDGEEETPTRGGTKPVTFVKIIAQQTAPIKLDANGEGTVELYIPDFNGELRLMAQTWSEEHFGSAEAKMVVAAPVIVELSTPRFLAGGDQSMLAMDLKNLSGLKQDMKITLSSKGLIGLGRIFEETVTLGGDEKKVLQGPGMAMLGFGHGDINVKVDGIVTKDGKSRLLERNVSIGVRPAHPAKTVNLSAVVRPGEEWILPGDTLAEVDVSSADVNLSISSRPPLNLRQYISELYAYPYGCLEQTTSGIFPSLYANTSQLSALGIKTSTDEARRESIIIGIERLLAKQQYHGGFGYWNQSDSESFWGSVYATDFLLRAKEQNYAVPEESLNKAVKRLQQYIQDRYVIDTYSDNAESTRFMVQAYAGLVLARNQKISLSDLRQLYERRDNAQSGLALVQLGIALKLMGDDGRADQVIKAGINKSRTSGWYNDYGSTTRDKALILSLLAEHNLLASERDKLLFSLSESLHSHQYLSTQEKNAVFMAGRNLINKPEAKWSAVLEGSVDEQWTSDKPVSYALTGNELGGEVKFINTSTETLYPRLSVTGYPLGQPAQESNNLSIHRQYFDTDGRPLSLSSLKRGQLVIVHLKVSANSGTIPDALVVDLLPAGLEIENQNLGDASASLKYTVGGLPHLLNQMQQSQISHQEFRDDRYVAAVSVSSYKSANLLYLARAVTPGVYNVPAPMVESMYRPAIRATGSTPGQLQIN